VTVPAADGGWEELCGALPDHATEVMTAHEGQPTVEVQDQRHGAGRPAVDNGLDTGPNKYGGGI
jgi:hypothetical protein